MKIDVLSAFPSMFSGPLTESIIKRARQKKLLDINIVDLRSFAKDKHKTLDDRPFGGGPGMVMKPEPLTAALESVGAKKTKCAGWPKNKNKLVIYLSPQGTPLTQEVAKKVASYKSLVLLCGHYEGIDERVLGWVNLELSIGDYVLTGGELPAMVLIDTVARLIPGVVKESGSVENDSFFSGILDNPHYTRPENFRGQKVPKVLLSGNHKTVQEWREEQAVLNTIKKRPDLAKTAKLINNKK